MSTRQDALEERISSIEDKIQLLQVRFIQRHTFYTWNIKESKSFNMNLNFMIYLFLGWNSQGRSLYYTRCRMAFLLSFWDIVWELGVRFSFLKYWFKIVWQLFEKFIQLNCNVKRAFWKALEILVQISSGVDNWFIIVYGTFLFFPTILHHFQLCFLL